jgi:putative membrane-bound dehydrogenase-like protein
MFASHIWAALSLIAALPPGIELPRANDPRLAIDMFAAEPLIVTPTGLAVDARGRVLVIESHTHFRPTNYQGPPADRIRMFEDTNGDGRADRVTTFFEGTTWTMSLAIARDGSTYVATRYEIFRLFDHDGDGKADQRVPIARLETPGTYPHNGLSGFAFDFAGNLYFGLGENLGAEYRLVGSDGITLSGGAEGGNVYRCRADGSGLERIATGFWNPFHLAFDTYGRLFAVDNDPDSRPPCRLLHIVENGDYGYRFRNGRKGLHPFTAWNGELPGTLPMVAGTGEAPSGVVAYESDHLPADYRGDLLATSWGDHRIERFRLEPRGASFQAVLEPVFTGGENFRPVGIVQAPDGSLFVSDWVDKSYPLHGKGRVWHIYAREPGKRIRFDQPSDALAHPDRAIRTQAARSLSEAGEQGREVLRKALVRNPDPRARALALEALMAQGDQASDAAFRAALNDSSDDIRELAVRLLPRRLINPTRIAAADGSAKVRAEALRRIVEPQSLPVLLHALEERDPFLTLAAREALKQSQNVDTLRPLATLENPAQRLGILLVLRDVGGPSARETLPSFLADADPAIRFAAIEWIGEERLTEFHEQLAEGLAHGAVTRTLFEAYLAALERLDGVRRDPKDEFRGEDYVARLVTDPKVSDSVRHRALRALRPDHPSLTISLLKKLLNSPDRATQLEAVRTLRESPRADRLGPLRALATGADMAPAFRAEAILGLSGEEDEDRALLITLAADPEPAVRREALRSLRGLPLSDDERAKLEKLASEDTALRALVGSVLGNGGRTPTPETLDVDTWLTRLEGPADASEGARIFFHPKGPGCYRCHQIDGRGGLAGPDLSTTARTLDRRRLVDSIVAPSREIAPQFVNWSIATTDGRVASGVLLEETPLGEQVYADAKGERFTLKASEIESRRPQTISLMPDDLARLMTVQEFRDLLAYLSRPRDGEDATRAERSLPIANPGQGTPPRGNTLNPK